MDHSTKIPNLQGDSDYIRLILMDVPDNFVTNIKANQRFQNVGKDITKNLKFFNMAKLKCSANYGFPF